MSSIIPGERILDMLAKQAFNTLMWEWGGIINHDMVTGFIQTIPIHCTLKCVWGGVAKYKASTHILHVNQQLVDA